MVKEMGEMTAEQKDKKQSHPNQFRHCGIDLGVTVYNKTMKNLKTIFFLLIIFKTNAVFALGDFISPKEIEEFYSNSTSRSEVVFYFNGLGSGVSWSNTMTQEKIFCLPPDLTFSGEDFYSIYKAEYLREKKLWDSLDSQPPGMILLYGLKNNFPCD